MRKGRLFVGFGFGAIQGGLFLYEAFRSGNFGRLVVAEVMPDTVNALRASGGTYAVNIATPDGIIVHTIEGIEVFNPGDPDDRRQLVKALAEADEIATALPSVDFFDRGHETSVARLLTEGFNHRNKPGIVYAAENHNHAAELLEQAVRRHNPALAAPIQFLNTVIGKMSGVVSDAGEIATQQLNPITSDLPRALLVEAFNRILISQIRIPGFQRGLTVFEEKSDLLPFEAAKLYGHNATHALLGYLAHQKGLRFMSDITADPELLAMARAAFLQESGGGLIYKYSGVDPLFTEAGFRSYADDLLVRMVNPFLRDAVDRIIRDPRRKLGWHDRLIGTMNLALDAGITPVRFARGAAAALRLLRKEQPGLNLDALMDSLWPEPDASPARLCELKRMMLAQDAKA
jgi:mannitol-1-phosphate 5-dehydrogenase